MSSCSAKESSMRTCFWKSNHWRVILFSNHKLTNSAVVINPNHSWRVTIEIKEGADMTRKTLLFRSCRIFWAKSWAHLIVNACYLNLRFNQLIRSSLLIKLWTISKIYLMRIFKRRLITLLANLTAFRKIKLKRKGWGKVCLFCKRCKLILDWRLPPKVCSKMPFMRVRSKLTPKISSNNSWLIDCRTPSLNLTKEVLSRVWTTPSGLP